MRLFFELIQVEIGNRDLLSRVLLPLRSGRCSMDYFNVHSKNNHV